MTPLSRSQVAGFGGTLHGGCHCWGGADMPGLTAATASALMSGTSTSGLAQAAPKGAAALAFGVELCLLGLLAIGKLNAVVFLVGHLAVVTALGFAVRRIARVGGSTTASVVLAIAVAATGPIGALGSLIGVLLPRRQPHCAFS
jgi:hypothetical protein